MTDIDISGPKGRVKIDLDPIEWLILFFIILAVLWFQVKEG